MKDLKSDFENFKKSVERMEEVMNNIHNTHLIDDETLVKTMLDWHKIHFKFIKDLSKLKRN
jgi:hypothetical protein